MRMRHRHMAVRVGMRFSRWIIWIMTVLMVFVMAVPVIMLHLIVTVLMGMAF